MRPVLFILLLSSFCSYGQIAHPYIAEHDDDVNCIAFSPDNHFIVTGGWDSRLIVYNNDSTFSVDQELKDFYGAVNSVSFSRDGYKMIAGGQEGKLAIYGFNDLSSWDVIGLDTFLELNRSQINKLIYGPGMRMIFSAYDDGKLMSYDIAKRKTMEIDTKRPISAACVSIDRRSFYIANEDHPAIVQYDLFGKPMRTLEGHTDDVTDLCVTPNRKYLISASKDRTIKVWNISNGKVERTFTDHTWTVTDIEIGPMGKYAVSCGLDGTVTLFDIATGEKLLTESLPRQRCNAVAISPDLTKIAVATTNVQNSDKHGFYIIPTGLKPRTVHTAKRHFVDKEEEEMYKAIYEGDEEEEQTKEVKSATPAAKKAAVEAKKNAPKPQAVEIKIED